MKNKYKWRYDNHPDLSGNKSILYCLDGGGFAICPAKEFFTNKNRKIGNWTWEKECNKLKNNFTSENKLFYCYFPDYYYSVHLKEIRKIIDDMRYQNPKNDERGALWIFDEGRTIVNSIFKEGRQFIKNEFSKYLPDDVAQMYNYFLFN